MVFSFLPSDQIETGVAVGRWGANYHIGVRWAVGRVVKKIIPIYYFPPLSQRGEGGWGGMLGEINAGEDSSLPLSFSISMLIHILIKMQVLSDFSTNLTNNDHWHWIKINQIWWYSTERFRLFIGGKITQRKRNVGVQLSRELLSISYWSLTILWPEQVTIQIYSGSLIWGN